MSSPVKNIAVIGLGYIGLPTAAILAAQGAKVVGVDINFETVAMINAGKTHIIEPELSNLVKKAVNSGFLVAQTSPTPAEIFLITVPTPFQDNFEPDLKFVNAAVDSLAPMLKKGDLIILESTSPVGTTEKISQRLAAYRTDLVFPHDNNHPTDIHTAYCPERVMPGQIVRELMQNDRIIGGLTPECADKATELYQLFVSGQCVKTNARIAEMTKLTENAFRDVNIAFANELSMICDKLKINVWELIKLANHHPRVNILQPGAGVGGHCIAVDPWFIVNAARDEARLIQTAREVNDSKPKFICDKVKARASEFTKPVIACLGLAYKANSDDLRESPAIEIVHELAKQADYQVLVVEPHINALPKNLMANSTCTLTPLENAILKADLIVLLVNHKQFNDINTKIPAQKIIMNMVGDAIMLSQPANRPTHDIITDEIVI